MGESPVITARDLKIDPVFRAARVGGLPQDAMLTTLAPSNGSRTIRIRIEANGSSPPWLDALLDRIGDIAGLETGWDSYNGRPPAPGCIARAIDVVSDTLMEFDHLRPTIVPTPAGNIQIELQSGAESLEIHVSLDEVIALYEDTGRQIEWEAPLSQRREDVRQILMRWPS